MNDKNFYENIIVEIKENINKREHTIAIDKIILELKMPYIPRKYETILRKMFDDLSLEMIDNKSDNNGNLNKDKIIDYLNSKNTVMIAIAVDGIKKINIRDIQGDLKLWIEDDNIDQQIAKTLIIQHMIDQSIDVDISFNKRVINPSKEKGILDNDSVKKIITIIDEKLYKEPQLQNSAIQVLNHYLLVNYPAVIDDPIFFAKSLCNIAKNLINPDNELTEIERDILSSIH